MLIDDVNLVLYIVIERPIYVNMFGGRGGAKQVLVKGFHGNVLSKVQLIIIWKRFCKYDIFLTLDKLILYLFYIVDINY